MTLVNFAPKPATRTRRTNHGVNNFFRNTPLVNIYEEGDAYKIQLAVPGIPKEHIQLDIKDDHLIIEAVKPSTASSDTQQGYLRKEYDFTSFKKIFTLNEEINQAAISASMADGLLTIQLDKKEEAKAIPPRSITIK